MAGGSQQQNPMATAANAIASGSGGTAGADAQQASMPQWQKGLMGAMTGNAAFGKNAPAIHQLIQQGMSGMNPPQQQMRPPMQAPPGFNAQGMQPPMQGQPGPMQGMPPGGMPQGQQQQNPWLQGLNVRQ